MAYSRDSTRSYPQPNFGPNWRCRVVSSAPFICLWVSSAIINYCISLFCVQI
ncbi:hypothetical protein K474DRAFT_1658508 [Panus rudis PR-1116 ss-1]|nr:hypothetical protein K474DRAFT_1658508 [Panus rudis PR-1116 ss-1]